MNAPQKMMDEIGRIRINEGVPKGVAIEYALHLARLKPDGVLFDFGVDQTQPCNLGMKEEQFRLFNDFRSNHDPVLDKNGAFFSAAVHLGVSLYREGYRLSEKKSFETAELVEKRAADQGK